MREIKFRGKSIMTAEELRNFDMDDSGWVYGNLLMNGKQPYIVGEIVEATDEYLNHEFWIPVDPKSVGQFTGEIDRNGKGIYEGDILKFFTNDYEEGEYSKTRVKHDGGALSVEVPWGFDYDYTAIGWAIGNGINYEVIGNQFDNPELLEESTC